MTGFGTRCDLARASPAFGTSRTPARRRRRTAARGFISSGGRLSRLGDRTARLVGAHHEADGGHRSATPVLAASLHRPAPDLGLPGADRLADELTTNGGTSG